VHQVIEDVELRAEAVIDRLHAELHGQVALPDTGRAEEEDVLLRAHVRAGSERLERLTRRQTGQLERRGDATLILALDLALQHEIEKAHRSDIVTCCFLHELGKDFGDVQQFERRALRRHCVEIDLAARTHRAASHALHVAVHGPPDPRDAWNQQQRRA
jgi:hypothetical protein